MAKNTAPAPAETESIVGILTDDAIKIALKKLHRQHADSQIAFGKTVAQQKRLLPVSDDLPSKVYLVTAGELRAEARRRGIIKK